MRIFPILLSLMLSFAVLANNAPQTKDDIAINKTYDLFSEAFDKLNAALIGEAYTESACYIPERHDKEIIRGRDAIVSVYEKFFGKIRSKNARIEVDFRVIDRSRAGDSVTDVGYYLIRFHPASDTGEPVSEYAGKFVTVSRKQADGNWLLSIDSSNRSEPRFYYQTQPVGELYFGQRFISPDVAKKP
ncbi:conserved hypothetical protein [Shewanella amazonensis SB2B]|uniref:Uncharacterized protein n=1 Tax=Shewanella amazonensis (strain ATCC BAA-1098 / SB2B) TaxID=326297 RepID=A1S6L8_SHEAM|nr:nuclear transport factor 2 family protein [Shewanella amazonensis]ABM00025.1 conserved hypothetical protein [Shewanella amazonensis SB2B]